MSGARQAILGVVAQLLMGNAAIANELALGGESRIDGMVVIAIQPPVDFGFGPRAQIMMMRQAEILKHPELVLGRYVPSDVVFGAVEDRKPWWGTVGQAFFGAGMDSVRGPSEESRFILNPYLLVGDAEMMAPDNAGNPDTNPGTLSWPTYIQPVGLRWWPRERRAEVTYEVSAYKSQMCRLMGVPHFETHGDIYLEVINARDLGLNYMYIPPQWAYNLKLGTTMKSTMKIPQFIHCGGSCGYPGGCNNMSPATPELTQIRITKLPARLIILLWRQPPVAGREPPDMTFTINYR